MRTIKFRAWNTELKQFEYSEDINGTEKGGSWFGDCILSDKKRYPVLQEFTGLYDKKGTLIFEGDIVTDGGDRGYVEFTLDTVTPCFIVRVGESLQPFMGFNFNLLEVVGNIYENPELLKS